MHSAYNEVVGAAELIRYMREYYIGIVLNQLGIINSFPANDFVIRTNSLYIYSRARSLSVPYIRTPQGLMHIPVIYIVKYFSLKR